MVYSVELSPTKIHEFFEMGYITFAGLFSRDEVNEMSEAIDRLQEKAKGLEGKVMHQGSQFVVESGRIKRVVWAGAAEPTLLQYGRDSRITSIAAQLLGSSYAEHLINQVHFKLPKDDVFYPFHQDSYHRGYGTNAWGDVNGRGSYVQIVTAIDESTLENGPLLFIPQSCKKGHLGLPYDENKPTVSDKFNPEDTVPLLIKPGDAAAFGPYTIHGSTANNSSQPRRAFINGFACPGANGKIYPGEGAGRLVRLA